MFQVRRVNLIGYSLWNWLNVSKNDNIVKAKVYIGYCRTLAIDKAMIQTNRLYYLYCRYLIRLLKLKNPFHQISFYKSLHLIVEDMFQGKRIHLIVTCSLNLLTIKAIEYASQKKRIL